MTGVEMTEKEILENLESAKLLICERTTSRTINPGTMCIGSFEDLLKKKNAVFKTTDTLSNGKSYIYISAGIYECLPDGSFRNIHAKIRKLIYLGYLDVKQGRLVKTNKQ